MAAPPNREDVHARARRLFADGVAGDPLVTARARVAPPVAVLGTGGTVEYWFVAVTVDERVAGFMQFEVDGSLMRYSSFQRRGGSIEGCPDAASWLDPATIQARAAAHLAAGERPGTPYLTYDRHPTRLAWAVPVLGGPGQARTLMVTGEYVYAADVCARDET